MRTAQVLVMSSVGPWESVGGDIKFLRLKQRAVGGLVTDGSVRDTDTLLGVATTSMLLVLSSSFTPSSWLHPPQCCPPFQAGMCTASTGTARGRLRGGASRLRVSGLLLLHHGQAGPRRNAGPPSPPAPHPAHQAAWPLPGTCTTQHPLQRARTGPVLRKP
jgi:hypothetical protein